MHLPFRPIKGQAFLLYLGTNISNYNNTSSNPAFSAVTFQISKDGGAFASLTNTPTEITGGIGSVTLTATEMTADVIMVKMSTGTSPRYNDAVSIYTQPNELSAAPASTDSMASKITAIWQYLIGQRTVTATQEKLYKSDGTTVLATGTVSDDGTTFTKGSPS